MRTSVFLVLLSTFGLFWLSSIACLENFNSSIDLTEENNRHIYLHGDGTKQTPSNETSTTENPHKGHGMSTATDAKPKIPELQNTEPEIIEFFRAASEGAVDDTGDRKPDSLDIHAAHARHMTTDHDHGTMKPSRTPKVGHAGHTMESDHEGHGMEDYQHDKHVTDDQMHDMQEHDSHADHDHHMKMDKNMSGPMHDMMMKMYFHTGVKEVILFKEWATSTVGGLLGSMIGIFLFAMLYEGLKYIREHLFKKYVSSIQFSTVAVTGESGRVTQVHKVQRHHMMSWPHTLQTVLHVVQIIMSYFLMLIFMTFNVWLCLAVVLGSGAGFFVFGWKKATVVDITEHCH